MPGVTEEQIIAARRMTAIEFLRRYRPGELVKTDSRGEFELREHDSFKINEETSFWHWKSRDAGGKSALDYLIKVEGVKFVDAVLALCEENPCYIPPPSQPEQEKEFALPPASANNRRVFAYLLMLQSVTALLNRAIKNREKLKPEERHCECLSIEVLRLNNEIDRQMTNPRANADQLLQLIMDCAKAKYEVSESGASEQMTQLIQERLADQPLISDFDYDLFSSITEKILIQPNASVHLQLRNGKMI